MSHNTRVRADQTAWQAGVVTDDEWEQIDLAQYESINGDQGGIWAPVTTMVLGGTADPILEIDGKFLADTIEVTTLNVTGNATLGDSGADFLTVYAVSGFDGAAFFNGGAEVTGLNAIDDTVVGATPGDFLTVYATSAFDGPAFFNGGAETTDLTVTDDATFGDAVQMDGDLNVDGTTTIAELLSPLAGFTDAVIENLVIPVGGALVLNEPMIFTTQGRIPLRYVLANDANQDIRVGADGNFIDVPQQTATHTYTVYSDDAQEGDWIVFNYRSAATLDFAVTINFDASLGPSKTMTVGLLTAILGFYYTGSAWHEILAHTA